MRNGEPARKANLPFRFNMMHRIRNKHPWLGMQTLDPFTEEGVVRWPELV